MNFFLALLFLLLVGPPFPALKMGNSDLLISPPHIVCIDPGHGGNDPGATAGTITEAEETLDISQRLRILLLKKGYQVVMTRTNDNVTLSNSERAAVCNYNKATVLISIHLNASDDLSLDYSQGLYGTGVAKKDEAFTQLMHEILVSSLSLPDEGITDFGDNILMQSDMPATLQETVILTNPTEYQLLTDGTGNRQQQIAEALFGGIQKWFGGK